MHKKSKEYQELQALWYSKLKASGFKDIEQDEDQLAAWHNHYFLVRFPHDVFRAKELYYQAAGRFLYDHQFKNAREQAIWALHAEGVSIRQISAILTAKGTLRAGKDTVHSTLQRLSKIMMESWTDEGDDRG